MLSSVELVLGGVTQRTDELDDGIHLPRYSQQHLTPTQRENPTQASESHKHYQLSSPEWALDSGHKNDPPVTLPFLPST